MSDAASADMPPTWAPGERGLLRVVAELAPSVHNTLPWRLAYAEGTRTVSLHERADRALPHHDRRGRDRMLSCGAALTNILLGLRVLAWEPEVRLLPARGRPDEVARIVVRDRREPTDEEVARFVAVSYRRSHRAPFQETPVEAATVRRLAAHGVAGVAVRRLNGRHEADALAKLLCHTASVLRLDLAYQRELTAWTAADERPGAGVAVLPRRDTALPWAGPLRRSTAVPDPATLADGLARECLLVLETQDDGPLDHLRAGMALEEMWLTACCERLACAVLTQPLQVPEVRSGLVEALSLNGFPQVICRLGYRPQVGS